MKSRAWFRLGGLAVAIAAAYASGGLLWRSEVVPRVERSLARATGHRVVVGRLSVRWGAVIGRDVVVFGAPPFQAERLARVERVTVRLGGEDGFFSPAEVTADGVDVEYLAAGDIDNVRGSRARSARVPGRRAAALPPIHVRGLRARATVQRRHAPRVVVRVRHGDLDLDPSGGLRARLAGVVAEVAGLATIRFGDVAVDGNTRDEVKARAGGGAVIVPGGGALVDQVIFAGRWSPRRSAELTLRAPAAGEPTFRISGRGDGHGGHLSIEARSLSVAALAPFGAALGIGVENARAEVHAMASLSADRADLPFEMDLRVHDVALNAPTLDRVAWRGLKGEVHLSGAFDATAGRVRVDSGELAVLGARLLIAGWTDVGEEPRGSWMVRTPPGSPLACAALLRAQAAPVRETLAGFEVTGNLGAAVTVTYDAAAWESLALDLKLHPLCQVVSEPAALARLAGALIRGEAPAGAAAALPLGPYHPEFARIDDMPPHLPAAFLTAEDGHFFGHAGFDLEMIRRALAHDLETRSFAKGASTLTQQLAKNVFLSHHRTLARKLEETVFAWRLHQLLPKRRILELYLNIVELGPGIRGVKQAARMYFGKDVSQLRPIEAAHLAALTPNPHGYARRFRDGRVDEGWLQRLQDLLSMMKRSGRLSAADLGAARGGTLTLRKI